MSQKERYQELRQVLVPERLVQMAKEQTGLSDVGDESFFEPMKKLFDCAAREVDFHAQGLEVFNTSVVRFLVNRLRMQNDLKLHPEILDEDVSDPIIIIGLGRSGTTKLHKMLSVPDDVQKTLFWRQCNPAPFTDAVPGQPDPRIAAANFSELITEDKPGLNAAHHMSHMEVEEDWMLYPMTFDDWGWTVSIPTFSYFDWVMQRSSLVPYRYVKTVLQYLQWQDGGRVGNGGGRPWVLKSIGHFANLDSVLDCYPNATFVHPHRDPRDTIPSWAKFQVNLWAIESNPLDPHLAGKEVVRMMTTATNRYLEARDRLGLNDRILDVSYDQVRTDPMSIMKAVYRRAGRAMSADAESKMAAWHDSNEQGRFGKHEYSLEEFGLSKTMIENAFAEYIERFIDH